MKIIVDTDPGADDSMAILMLLTNKPQTDIIAVTTVTGNADIDSVTDNAIRTLEIAKRTDIPVYKGASQGLLYEAKHNFFFGVDGFGESSFDTALPEGVLKEETAANILVDRVKAMPNELTILAIGPLTNIAIAIALCPNFLQLVKHLIVFGGSYLGVGNAKPGSEFNFYGDPEAAQLVLSRAPIERPILLVPLETVRDIAFPMDWRLNVFGKLNSIYVSFMNKIEGLSLTKRDTWVPYDPTAASILINPEVITKTSMVSVKVLCCPEFARGVMITDYNCDYKNVQLVTKVDKEIFQKILLDCFDRNDI